MSRPVSNEHQSVWWLLLVAIAYFGLATAALALTGGTDGTATIWPSSGIAIAALLLGTQSSRPRLLGTIALASFCANMASGIGLGLALGFTFANTVEAAIGYVLIRNINRRSETIYNPLSVVEFCAAAILTATASGAIAVLVSGQGFGLMFLSWVTTVALGIMIVVPLIVNFAASRGTIRKSEPIPWLRYFIVMSVVVAIALLSFSQSTYPSLFLPLLTVIVATYLLGPNGATFSIVLIAAIGSVETSAGFGPIQLVRAHQPDAVVLVLQFYLFALLLAALPLAALLNARERALAELIRSNRWLEMAESFAHVGHWRLDLITDEVVWSDEVFRIHGLPIGKHVELAKAIDFYHADDRAIVEDVLASALQDHTPFEFEARLIRCDGQTRYVSSRGEIEHAPDGSAIAIFGIFQDVTDRALASIKLAKAREDAEHQAHLAMALAQTDPLTGIANRRSTLAVLESAVERAQSREDALSVAILDIDHFKSINDRFGHATGDEVIKAVADICSAAIRSSDLAGRIGGEEFVLVLPGAGPDIATHVGERVRCTVETHDWAHPELDRVTASIGLATFEPGMDAHSLLDGADKALYRAKREGRNQLRVAA